MTHSKDRPVHLGPLRCERLARGPMPDLAAVPPFEPLRYRAPEPSVVNAMRDHAAVLDAIRGGPVNAARADAPDDPGERARHLRAFAHFADATVTGICAVPEVARLAEPHANPDVGSVAGLASGRPKTLAAGIDAVMADLREAVAAPVAGAEGHGHALVMLHRNPRPVDPAEPGAAWIAGAHAHRGALLAAETATVIANYLRLLGWEATAHTASAADVDLHRLAVAAGVLRWDGERLDHPLIDGTWGLAAVTTTFALEADPPLAAKQSARRTPAPFARRRFADGAHAFETLRRVDVPTTFIDEPNVARVPKRADMFARAQFGDLGKKVQAGATGGLYVRKAAPSAAQRRALGAFVLLQDGAPAPERARMDPEEAAALVKATSYFLGIDAVGISRCPDWTWYSHDAAGDPIEPPHDQAVSMIVDQGFETMEGASGDDWISVAQSMRAYLRFSLLGGVVAAQIRRMGYSAKAHSVMDGEVLQPPLLLLSGLGEVSRIGEVILNPFLGPRLKSGVVTTDLPMAHDKPIDFGLQRFCEGCRKCARECPSGAITAGPKRMFNGYEIWKSDSQKCASYRITTRGGAMCGRCMKTCPWNLEGSFREAPFRWAAMKAPWLAPALAKLDDAAGRGGLNPAKRWWWDLELDGDGAYRPTEHPVNRRDISPELDVRAEDQTLAVYPANLAPPPWPYPFPADREAGIEAYRAMPTVEAYRARLARGEAPSDHRFRVRGDAPVTALRVERAERAAEDVMLYELRAEGGEALPSWEAGAHLDVVVAPEFLRSYSLTGDPADRTRYRIAVLREAAGRGGSMLMHRIFEPGRKVWGSRPANHFPLDPDAPGALLMAGGIGITPLVAMAHALHRSGRPFALHYSGRSRAAMAMLGEVAAAPWADRVRLHVSGEGARLDPAEAMRGLGEGWHVYACGGAGYMAAVLEEAGAAGVPEARLHREFFAVPEVEEGPMHPFTLRLRSGREVAVPEGVAATDALSEAGVAVDVKCADGLCGVCRCGVVAGAVDHRDHVLSAAERAGWMILCRSRAAEAGGTVAVDL